MNVPYDVLDDWIVGVRVVSNPDKLQRRSLHPREPTRRLADKVLAAAGQALLDDATLLVLDWHGHHARDGGSRDSLAGADSAGASEALS